MRDTVLTACYLINQMPSIVLDDQISYFVLYLKHDLFSLPPRIFGCVCFVHDHSTNRTKLNPKAFKCEFLDILEVKNDIYSAVPLYISL